jgi:hypothetical protein
MHRHRVIAPQHGGDERLMRLHQFIDNRGLPIEHRDVVELLREVQGEDRTKRAYIANRVRAALSRFLKWTISEAMIPSRENSVAGTEPRRGEIKRECVLTDEEIGRVWGAADSSSGVRPARTTQSSAGGTPAHTVPASLPSWTPKIPMFGRPRNRVNFSQRNDHGRILGALRVVNGRSVGERWLVQVSEAEGHVSAAEIDHISDASGSMFRTTPRSPL